MRNKKEKRSTNPKEDNNKWNFVSGTHEGFENPRHDTRKTNMMTIVKYRVLANDIRDLMADIST
jgi:hypothetical protein